MYIVIYSTRNPFPVKEESSRGMDYDPWTVHGGYVSRGALSFKADVLEHVTIGALNLVKTDTRTIDSEIWALLKDSDWEQLGEGEERNEMNGYGIGKPASTITRMAGITNVNGLSYEGVIFTATGTNKRFLESTLKKISRICEQKGFVKVEGEF